MKRPKPTAPDRYVIILAGGRGERFWPVSREKRPKQLTRLLGEQTLLQQTLERVQPLAPLENTFVITTATQQREVARQLPSLPKTNIIAEPCGRDTCAAVALGAALVGARSTTAVMAVLPADQIVTELKTFRQVLTDALDLASRGQVLVTIGIKPTEPATGFGYIQSGPPLPPPQGAKPYRTAFHRVERFVEKPNLDKALEYLTSGSYRWNAGMFVWSFVSIVEGLATHQPPMAEACRRWFKAIEDRKLARVLADDYPALSRISIDYALMEKARNIVVADGDFGWNDLGAWPSLARHLKADPEGNCALGDFVHVDSARNLVVDARTSARGVVAALGLRDSVVVLTDDAVLVASRTEAQRVRELVTKLGSSDAHRRFV